MTRLPDAAAPSGPNYRDAAALAGLDRERIEEQMRRAHRWNLPRSARAYPTGPRCQEYAVDVTPHLEQHDSNPRYATAAVGVALFCNSVLLFIMAVLPAPKSPPYEEPTLRLVIAEARTSQPLETLAVDISTPLGREPQWDRFDKALGVPSDLAPLAVPSVIDRFIGNPLSVFPNSGGDVIVGGSRGMASRGEQFAGAKILGVRARGERFVFVLDNSIAMVGPAWKQARREVLAGVARLREGQRFAVLLADGTHYPVKGSFQADAMHVARIESAAQLAQWLDTRQLVQTPTPMAAVESAVARHADAIYLIGATAFPSAIADQVRRSNRWIEEDRLKVPGSVLHAIGVSFSKQQTAGLARIAHENGGHFVHVMP